MSFGSATPSQSSSKTVFPAKFLNQATKYFGPAPAYNPQYVGFSPDKIQQMGQNMYTSQVANLDTQRNQQEKIQNEELSNSGLLTSPAQYMAGGAKDVLNQNYAQQVNQAARDAQLAELGMTQEEAQRQTGFNTTTAENLANYYMQKLGLAANAGKQATETGPSASGVDLGGAAAPLFSWGLSKLGQ